MLTLESLVEDLSKTTKPLVAALKKLNIKTVVDLIWYLPYRYLDFSKTTTIAELKTGENVSLKVTIKSIGSRFSFRSRMSLAEAVVSDETGSLKVTWFNQAYLAKTLKPGDEVYLAGKADFYNGKIQLTNPVYEKFSEDTETAPIHTSRLVPVYHLSKNIYPKTFRNLIAGVLELTEKVTETLPKNILVAQNLLPISETLKQSHFPGTLEDFEKAKQRLAFEEIFLNQLLAQKHKIERNNKPTFQIPFDQELTKSFLARLPFDLTNWQKKAAWEALQDLEKPVAMNRLLEGDVGSGKTLVSFLTALSCLNKGLQVVLLAPTEILAKQHFETAKKYFLKPTPLNFNCRCALLTAKASELNYKSIEKKKLLEEIKQGMPVFMVGTHAILQKKVQFKNLALVIIDEQHRFGVEQRNFLFKSAKKPPHLLSLSATPIPRSLQLAFFGELEISQIKSKPANRKTIITKLVENSNRQQTYKFIDQQIQQGRQAFVVTPRIEENENQDIKSAKAEVLNLQKIFKHRNIGLLHGKLKATEKEQVMARFLANEIQILVSTSVVEVGVDVPNASVMVIEGAERFGLAQLHQFRGRVGRAEHQSYCFLFPTTKSVSENALPQTTTPFRTSATNFQLPSRRPESCRTGEKGIPFSNKNSSGRDSSDAFGVAHSNNEDYGDQPEETIKRLIKFTKTQDGFELAEMDLKQRGFGDLYGSSQSGINFKYFDPSYTDLIPKAKQEALNLLKKDFELNHFPILKNAIAGKTVHFE